MSVKIRLQRKGKKNHPCYSIVATDSRSPRDGKFLEYLGYYNPHKEEKKVLFLEDRIKYWLGEGAQPTKTVSRLLGYAQMYPRCPIMKRKELGEN